MSTLEIAITRLKAVTAVTDIVTANRIYPVAAPQKAVAPYVVVGLAAEEDEQLLAGAAKLYKGRVQVDCVAADGNNADLLGEAVKAALEDVVKASIAGKTVDSEKDGIDFTQVSDDRTAFRRVIGFYIRWQ